MLIIGAKGFAKEVLEVLHQQQYPSEMLFFDNVTTDLPETLFGQFNILRSTAAAAAHFQNKDTAFCLGMGNPALRQKMVTQFEQLGGQLQSTISPFAHIGHFENQIAPGANIMTAVVITNSVTIGKGVLLNITATVGHDCIIGNFVEVCPAVNISGNVTIGDYSFVGTNATILPGVSIGKNCVVGAGAVVTKDIPDNTLALGSPAKPIKELPPLVF